MEENKNIRRMIIYLISAGIGFLYGIFIPEFLIGLVLTLISVWITLYISRKINYV